MQIVGIQQTRHTPQWLHCTRYRSRFCRPTCQTRRSGNGFRNRHGTTASSHRRRRSSACRRDFFPRKIHLRKMRDPHTGQMLQQLRHRSLITHSHTRQQQRTRGPRRVCLSSPPRPTLPSCHSGSRSLPECRSPTNPARPVLCRCQLNQTGHCQSTLRITPDQHQQQQPQQWRQTHQPQPQIK